MRLLLNVLPKPLDPIVASYASRKDADQSLAALGRAGFGRTDLTVLGHAGMIADRTSLAACAAGGMRRWATSGTGLGLLWAVFACAAVALFRSGAPALGALVALGLLTLWLQDRVIRAAMSAARDAPIRPAAPLPGQQDDQAGSAWRFHLVVHGSRSDVALARAILDAR